MWDLVGNPEDRFSHNEAQIKTRNRRKEKKTAIKMQELEINKTLYQIEFNQAYNHHFLSHFPNQNHGDTSLAAFCGLLFYTIIKILKFMTLKKCDQRPYTRKRPSKDAKGMAQNADPQSDQSYRPYMYHVLSEIIMLTCPYNGQPLTPHFYILKLGYT